MQVRGAIDQDQVVGVADLGEELAQAALALRRCLVRFGDVETGGTLRAGDQVDAGDARRPDDLRGKRLVAGIDRGERLARVQLPGRGRAPEPLSETRLRVIVKQE